MINYVSVMCNVFHSWLPAVVAAAASLEVDLMIAAGSFGGVSVLTG